MGTNAFVRLQADSTGKKVGTFEVVAGSDTVELQAVVLVDSAGNEVTLPSSQGADNFSVGRGTASTSAATLAIARATRRGILITNLDASLTIYVGPATVTTANGFPISPGQAVLFTWLGLIQVISASGTPAWACADEYD